MPGDMNQGGMVDIADPIALLDYLFNPAGSFSALPCGDGSNTDPANVSLMNWNGDAQIDLGDPISMLNYLFGDGPVHPLGKECVRIVDCPDVCVSEE